MMVIISFSPYYFSILFNKFILNQMNVDSQADIDEIPDSEDEVDLLYDAALNCYYDPKTGTYYELNLES